MEDKNKKDENNIIYFIQNDSTYFIIIRQLKNNILEIIEEEYKESTKSKTKVLNCFPIFPVLFSISFNKPSFNCLITTKCVVSFSKK